MKNIIKLEEVMFTIAGIYLLTTFNLGISQWWYILLFFAPDASMAGYVINNKTGAWLYNIFHHRGLAVGIGFLGLLMSSQLIMFIGVLLFAHSSFDRMMGYGLKLYEGFKHTHLGVLK